MRIELNKEYDILYIELRPDLEVERTEDYTEGVHLDLAAEDEIVGMEFLSLEAFDAFVEAHPDLSGNPIDWLRVQADLRQMLLR